MSFKASLVVDFSDQQEYNKFLIQYPKARLEAVKVVTSVPHLRAQKRNKSKRWTEDSKLMVRDMYRAGHPYRYIAESIGRTRVSVEQIISAMIKAGELQKRSNRPSKVVVTPLDMAVNR